MWKRRGKHFDALRRTWIRESETELFESSVIAVVGASRTEGKIGYVAMENTTMFDGPVYPVNPSGSGKLFSSAFSRGTAFKYDHDGSDHTTLYRGVG